MEQQNLSDEDHTKDFKNVSGLQKTLKRKAVLDHPESSSSKKDSHESSMEVNMLSTALQYTTEEASCSVSRKVHQSKEVKNKQKASVTIMDLPLEIIKLIFSYLHFNDMVKMQNVCHSWDRVTRDTLLWKHAPLVMRGHNTGIFSSVPYLHTVTGLVFSGDDMLNSLVENVLDLRKIDCRFYCYLFPESLQKFLLRFVNLEYFVLDNENLTFVKLLNFLSSSPNLTALKFHYNNDLKNFPYVCKVIGDGFSALKKLYIMQGLTTGKNHLSDVIKKKINQLTELSLNADDVYPDVLGLILKSKMLEKLEISGQWPEILLDFSNMINLKNLCVSVNYQPFKAYCSMNLLQEIEFPKSLESVTVYMHKSSDKFSSIISKVIKSLPNLKVLVMEGVQDDDINEQLEHINNLQNLHTVSFASCPGLSAVGLEHITKCKSLRKLKIMSVFHTDSSYMIFTDKSYECLKGCKYLGDVDLSYCLLNFEKLLSTILEMEYLTNIYLCGCKHNNEVGKYVRFTDDEINIMRLECRQKNRNVKVNGC